MFVTSDIFDLKRIGQFRDYDWKEDLVCGVDFYGTAWRGRQAGAKFLVEAAKLCELLPLMQYGGYNLPGISRTRPIVPRSIVRLAEGNLSVARGGISVLLTGLTAGGPAPDPILVGGEAAGVLGRNKMGVSHPMPDDETSLPVSGHFLFPFNDQAMQQAVTICQLAADLLDADYAYYFVRDELCFPGGYAGGIGSPLDYSPLAYQNSEEIGNWARFVRTDRYWIDGWPKLRDLFEINLLSDQHMTKPIQGLGYLSEWTSARPGRGRLEDIGRGRMLWILSDAEIFELRPLLYEAGLLLSCLPRVYRDLPGGRAPVEA